MSYDIHPETQRVLDYKDSVGKRVAMKYFNWDVLDRVEEAYHAAGIIVLAKMIDEEISKSER